MRDTAIGIFKLKRDHEIGFPTPRSNISAGSVGNPDDYITLGVRTLVGKHLLKNSVDSKK